MNIDWLKYFIAICEAESFKEASNKIGLTSPALSKAILELENFYKVTLIKRKNKFEGLTPAGELLFKLSKNIISDINDMQNQMSNFVDGEPQGNISICSEALVQNYLLPKVMINIINKYPKIYPKMYLMISDVAEKNVLEGKVDLGIITREPMYDSLEYIELLDIPHVIVGKPQEKRNWDEFCYIIPRFFGIKYEVFVDGWNDKVYKRKSLIEVEGLETTIKFCESSTGVAFLPKPCVEEQLKNGSLAVVSDPPFTYSDKLFLFWSKNTIKTKAFFKVLEEIQNSLSKK